TARSTPPTSPWRSTAPRSRRARTPRRPTMGTDAPAPHTSGGDVGPDTSRDISLDITGMTCASCAMRIEKRLNKLDGVEATVNYATEKAKVSVANDADVSPDDLVAQVEAAGYAARVHRA